MFEQFKAGDEIRCTVNAVPNNQGGQRTIERLMRRSPSAIRRLRNAQHLRARRMHRYTRGNRLWTSREQPAMVVQLARGESWTMPFTVDIAPDLASVATYLKIEKA